MFINLVFKFYQAWGASNIMIESIKTLIWCDELILNCGFYPNFPHSHLAMLLNGSVCSYKYVKPQIESNKAKQKDCTLKYSG